MEYKGIVLAGRVGQEDARADIARVVVSVRRRPTVNLITT